MKKLAVALFIYAALLLVGGLIGHLKANSIASLIMGTACAIIAFVSAVALWKGFGWGRWIALGLATLLFLFFGYRFLESYRFFPSGFMSIISLLVATMLLCGKTLCQFCKKS